jgi:chemotaxis protein methyltransferase CheR
MGQMDLILCRNVLIYFDEKTVVRVVKRLLELLSEGGSLMLGASDPLLVGLLPCEAEVTEAGLLYRQSANRTRPLVPCPRPIQPAEPARRPDLPDVLPVLPPPVAVAVPRTTVTGEDAGMRIETRRRYEAKDYAAVAELAEAMIRGGARDAEVEILLVRSLANRGDLIRAGLACATALDAHRGCAELAFLHAVLLTRAGRYAEAIGALRRALYLDRKLVVAHLALGDALARSGDIAGAARAFRAAGRLLAEMPMHEPVPGSDGEPAARLAEAARSQLRLLDQPVS